MQKDTTLNQLSDYLESLAFPNDLSSGNHTMLPEKDRNLLEDYLDESAELHSMHPSFCAKEDIEAQELRAVYAREEFLSQLESDLRLAGIKTGFTRDEPVNRAELVGAYGVEMGYGERYRNHIYAVDKRDVPLKPSLMSSDGLELLKARMKVNVDRIKDKINNQRTDNQYQMPLLYQTADNERLVVTKYHYGGGKLHAEVNGMQMSARFADDDSMNVARDIQKSPREYIVKYFGDRLGLREHYDRFEIPDYMHVSKEDVDIRKRPDSYGYDLHVRFQNGNSLVGKLADHDAEALLRNKATEMQLAAKYMSEGRLERNLSPASLAMEPDASYGRPTGNVKGWEKPYEIHNGIEHDNQQTNTQSKMAKKKTSENSSETPNVVDKATQKSENPQESMKSPEKEESKERRAPQMVTVNGDKVTHGHVFKSNNSDDWFFTAKINDVPLKPLKVSTEDMEGLMNKTKNVADLMQTYYPTKLMPKVPTEDMKLPVSIMTPAGEQRLYKFNVYKETHMDNVDYGKYRFYAQVDDQKMSASASRQDLNAYFDKVMKPADMVAKVFGDRLGMAEHYRQFQLPENVNIEAKDIRIMKNQQTNKYEIHANLGDHGKTSAKEISYDDKQSFFSYKTATKEQLAAKYLGNEISAAFKNAPKHEQAKQMSLGM